MTIDTFSSDMPIRQGLWNGFATTLRRGYGLTDATGQCRRSDAE